MDLNFSNDFDGTIKRLLQNFFEELVTKNKINLQYWKQPEEKIRENLEIWIKKYKIKCEENNSEFDEPRIRDIIDEWIIDI